MLYYPIIVLFSQVTRFISPLQVLDGRKVVGKVEVKIRLRDPVLTKQITQKKEKWLSIDRA